MKKNIKEAMIISPSGQTDSNMIQEDEDFEESSSFWYELSFPNDSFEDPFYIEPTESLNKILIKKVNNESDTIGEQYELDLSGEEPIFKKVASLDEKVKSVKKVIKENKNKLKKFKEAVCEIDEEQIKNIADDIRFIAADYFSNDKVKFDQLCNAAEEIEDYNFDKALDITSDIADNSPDTEIAESIWDAVAPLRQC